MKTLEYLLREIKVEETLGNLAKEVSSIEFDSRKVKPGSLFVAQKGTQTDGHDYIQKAIELGACGVICQVMPTDPNLEVSYIRVQDSSMVLGLICSAFYDFPSQNLKLVGVTGTNGKTTTATLLYNLFREAGFKAGLISTIKYYVDNKELPASHTTPDTVQLNSLMAEMVEAGCEYCFMEVSSHAIAQGRIEGLQFKGGIFSNLTHDHLDYHETFENYLKAKKTFFDKLPKDAFAVVNIDDRNGNVMVQNTKAKKYTYSARAMADFRVKILEHHFDGMLLDLDNHEVWTKFIGGFNAYNLLAVYSAAVLLGLPKEQVLQILSNLNPVEGRFDTLRSKNGVTIIVDYAHTPDALENVLKTIEEIRTGNEQLISLVGAGGNRDKTKRPVMARIVTEMSNKAILTSDNPRFEKPEDIIEDMRKGVSSAYTNKVLVIIDRREAIRTACMMAQKGDIILIPGKGHEDYQEVCGVKHHFNDKEIVRETLEII
jgi:UDP-N-acetylmuramoyl-L-alanyl-D-glutamate--2,6-diaminopimelate ligase